MSDLYLLFGIAGLAVVFILALGISLLWILYDQVREAHRALQRQKEFFTDWNQRIENLADDGRRIDRDREP